MSEHRRRTWRPTAGANPWSPEDVQQLRRLATAGTSLELIAVKLRRTRSAIRNKATMHGISLKGREVTCSA
jgi:hypothetical protein